jgi:hypothetical protein
VQYAGSNGVVVVQAVVVNVCVLAVEFLLLAISSWRAFCCGEQSRGTDPLFM